MDRKALARTVKIGGVTFVLAAESYLGLVHPPADAPVRTAVRGAEAFVIAGSTVAATWAILDELRRARTTSIVQTTAQPGQP